jgi:hypothetical protein
MKPKTMKIASMFDPSEVSEYDIRTGERIVSKPLEIKIREKLKEDERQIKLNLDEDLFYFVK